MGPPGLTRADINVIYNGSMSKHPQPISDAAFRTLHALRIKGFAKVDVVAEIADVPADDAAAHLDALRAQDLALYREARSLWQLTPAGKEEHAKQLSADIELTGADGRLGAAYDQFLVLNEELKNLCGEWQLRGGQPNDHADAVYDAAVIAKLEALNARAVPVAELLGEALARLRPYAADSTSTGRAPSRGGCRITATTVSSLPAPPANPRC